jgi:hypothetical protein
MFSKLTYKQKFYTAILFFCIILFASYKKTFHKTFIAKKSVEKVEKKVFATDNYYYQISNLKKEIQNLDEVIGGSNINPQNVQQSILNFVAEKQETNLIAIEDTHISSNSNFIVFTNQITLSGSYPSLIKCLFNFEKKFKDSKIVSIRVYSEKNRATKKIVLLMHLIFQNYKKK